VHAGKALYVGFSDTPAWIVSRAVTMAGLRGWSPFVALQVPYSLLERSVERELLPMARGLDLAVTTWSPLGDGLLSGRYGSDRPQPADSRVAGVASHRLSERNLRIADAVNIVAKGRDVSPAQVAIAWIKAQQRRAEIIPIIGVRMPAQLTDNLGALEITLTTDDRARLDAASASGRPGCHFGHEACAPSARWSPPRRQHRGAEQARSADRQWTSRGSVRDEVPRR
jgi:aryl-alcohol dehydrogenase-like predicted oxidoreductase